MFVLREKLGGVSVDFVEFPADIVSKVHHGFVDVVDSGEPGHLVLLLPRLDVHNGQSRV